MKKIRERKKRVRGKEEKKKRRKKKEEKKKRRKEERITCTISSGLGPFLAFPVTVSTPQRSGFSSNSPFTLFQT